MRNVCNSGEVCVPITHNLKYCNKIDNLTKDRQVRVIVLVGIVNITIIHSDTKKVPLLPELLR